MQVLQNSIASTCPKTGCAVLTRASQCQKYARAKYSPMLENIVSLGSVLIELPRLATGTVENHGYKKPIHHIIERKIMRAINIMRTA